MASTTVTFLAILFLSNLAFLHSAQEEDTYPSGCSPFYCGPKIQLIGFPFFNTMDKCRGLCEVNCSDSEQYIKLGNKSKWYDLLSISQANTIEICDQELNQQFNSQSCDSFQNFTRPYSPSSSISFKIYNNYSTFFKCTQFTSEADVYFRSYHNYTKCPGYSLYYSYPNNHTSLATASLPPNCSIIQLPLRLPEFLNSTLVDPFQLITARFLIGLHLTHKCSSCRYREGNCSFDKENRFLCPNEKEVIPGSFIFTICALVFIIWRHHKWNYVTHLLSRNTSSDPSSNEDLEGGSVYFGVPVFSYRELEEATKNFDPSKELGDGGFGTVYHGKLRDGREVAVKRLYENNYKRVEQFMNEVQILTRMRHRNLVLLYGCTSRRSRELLLVYEYIPNGTVADHLHGDRVETGSLTWPIRMNIAIETASALAYLHASDIIHRDVKTNNILLDTNFCVKVADFGLSRLFPNDVTHVSTAPQGTPGYVDPEYHQCYQLTDKSDVYSFGVVLIELISSMPAVDISRHRDEINLANLAINKIQKNAFNELIDPGLGFESDSDVERMTTLVAELAFRCLQLEKEMRPKMEEVLEALKGIKGYGEYKDEKTWEGDDYVGVLENVRPPPSPESEEVVLLKNGKAPPSPDTVTATWVSSSSSATIPITSG
ncbi:hypothetical protein LguiB_015091 [Lonicera macranthoides]